MSKSVPARIPIFRRTRIIGAGDLDELAHVNNVVWVRFVGQLAEAHSDALGLDLAAYRRVGGFWVVRRHEIDYHRPASAGDEVLEETWVSEMRGARCVRHARFRDVRDDALLLSATTLWAFVDAGTQRPRRVPADMLQRFTLLSAEGGGMT